MTAYEEQLSAMFDEDAEWEENDDTAEPQPSTDASLSYHPARSLLQAHAALLDYAVVSLEADAGAYRLVKTHFAALEQWHEQHTGWRIQRGSSFFRLERHLHMLTPVFLDDKLKKARDFVCLVWLLWFAEKRHLAGGGRNQQFLLSELVDEIQKQSSTAEGQALDFRNQQDRYSISRALDYLTRLGGLQALEGEIKKWLDDTEQPENEVLYEFTPITHSLVEALNVKRLAAITPLLMLNSQLLAPGTLSPLATEIPPLFRAWRALLLGPALFRYDDPEAFRALVSQSEVVSEALAKTFGWLLELNSDYACVVRGNSLSLGAGPTFALNSANDQMVLLLCSAFRQQVEQGAWSPDDYGCLRVTRWDIASLFSDLRQRYGKNWGSTVQNIKATELLEDIYERMRQGGLLRGPDAEGNALVLPTAARYSISYIQQQETHEEARSRSRARATASAAAPQKTFNWTEATATDEAKE